MLIGSIDRHAEAGPVGSVGQVVHINGSLAGSIDAGDSQPGHHVQGLIADDLHVIESRAVVRRNSSRPGSEAIPLHQPPSFRAVH